MTQNSQQENEILDVADIRKWVSFLTKGTVVEVVETTGADESDKAISIKIKLLTYVNSMPYFSNVKLKFTKMAAVRLQKELNRIVGNDNER